MNVYVLTEKASGKFGALMTGEGRIVGVYGSCEAAKQTVTDILGRIAGPAFADDWYPVSEVAATDGPWTRKLLYTDGERRFYITAFKVEALNERFLETTMEEEREIAYSRGYDVGLQDGREDMREEIAEGRAWGR